MSQKKVKSSEEATYVEEDNRSKTADMPYKKEMTGDDLEEYIEDIAETVRIGLDQSIAILTPWFSKICPKYIIKQHHVQKRLGIFLQ